MVYNRRRRRRLAITSVPSDGPWCKCLRHGVPSLFLFRTIVGMGKDSRCVWDSTTRGPIDAARSSGWNPGLFIAIQDLPLDLSPLLYQ
eukprot:scaffold23542_cov39-Attheya_sp.AAC.1